MSTRNERFIFPLPIGPPAWARRLAAAMGLSALLICGCSELSGMPEAEGDALVDARQLTRGFADATDAAISHDMQWIAFRGVPVGEEAPQLFLARVLFDDGARGDIVGIGLPIRVTPFGSRNASPVFSPDGRTLLFTSTAQAEDDPLRGRPTSAPALSRGFDAQAEIYRVDNWQRNLAAADPRAGVNFARHALAARPGFDGEPAFTPDGRHVLFASDREAPRSALDTHSLVDLYAMRPDGKGIVRLTREQGYDGAPAVSADGRHVTFHSDRAQAGQFDIYVAPLVYDARNDLVGAGEALRVTRGGYAVAPTVHPSGTPVVYVSLRDDRRRVGNAELHQMRMNGSHDLRLTFHPAADESPRFSANGNYILFSSRRTEDGSRQVFIARYARPRRT